MLPMFPRSKVLNFVYSTATKLKWTWDFLLFQSFSHPYNINTISENSSAHDELGFRIFEAESGSLLDSAECAVCLCKIEEGEEVRELRCNHLFHTVCLDRWLGYGRMTCPLCRNNLNNKPYCSHHFTNIHQEVILFDFFKVRSSDRRQWWLR
ncbi:putative e3 ubiquitin-protein ligase xerico [Nicotiana attenuata]|uniref:E3 ubiquitin-protein ligase xerico n=1 Tax=Nicotiana attenuata TaxID=49451 RepID=A0A1J6KD81_NICAT|nr:putative e3 ubiquitin-protein ligase xerico [Nicotiana attenuata]